MLFDDWNRKLLDEYTTCITGSSIVIIMIYAFEIYYQRTHKIPPKEYFNKSFDDYYLNYDIKDSGLYLDFDISLIKEFISEESFNNILK